MANFALLYMELHIVCNREKCNHAIEHLCMGIWSAVSILYHGPSPNVVQNVRQRSRKPRY
jgi:hypothetical protein